MRNKNRSLLVVGLPQLEHRGVWDPVAGSDRSSNPVYEEGQPLPSCTPKLHHPIGSFLAPWPTLLSRIFLLDPGRR